MQEFVDAREQLLKGLKDELIGPGSEDTGNDPEYELISESPSVRYTVGILFPQKHQFDVENQIDDTGGTEIDKADGNEVLDSPINTANQYYPSALGVSFFTKTETPRLNVMVSYAKYRKVELEDCQFHIEIPEDVRIHPLFQSFFNYQSNKIYMLRKMQLQDRNELLELSDETSYKKGIYQIFNIQEKGWKRVPEKSFIAIPLDVTSPWEKEVDEGLKLLVIKRPKNQDGSVSWSVVLVNEHQAKKMNEDEKMFFQVGFKVTADDFSICEFKSSVGIDDEEDRSLELLYRNKKTYAVGHGCAVRWELNAFNEVTEIATQTIPYYEVPQMKFEIEGLGTDLEQILEMKTLSDLSPLNKDQIIEYLRRFCDAYEEWINKTEEEKIPELSLGERDRAFAHMAECRYSHTRISRGVDLLEKNDKVFLAFSLANRAMFMQRVHTTFANKKRFPGDEGFVLPVYDQVGPSKAKWRPFQLAFLLMTLESIHDSNSPDRDIVDLIWFPTGGGKTEAYLGLSAFTIFHRRLTSPETGGGVAIIMRYTLRLLTAQQFERASALICGCELIRREMPGNLLGNTPISLGLWVGGDATPNTVDDAIDKLEELIRGSSDENPMPLLSCPWCGTRLTKDHGKGTWGYRRANRPKRIELFCPEPECPFSSELPIRAVDEDIYRDPPTFLFGTVDKFASLPWKEEISSLFGLNEGNTNKTPELIIQDELHLISGPLGTMVGLYETAIDALCSARGVKPKIISSTATIRRANEQCKALYARSAKQFPPSGIDAEDSFFATEDNEKPGRLYAGIMSSGKTQTTTLVRLLGNSLQIPSRLPCSDEVKDKFWTTVCYFNSIRELGKTLTLANDDVPDYIYRMNDRKPGDLRKLTRVEELTSRKKAEEIPHILEQLNVQYPSNQVIDLLLASNMISVGVDINRLGLMVVYGQPKTTSEYIQASSRVGRTYPGLVVTLYDGARPRDRSHFEHFTAYHQSFYKYVEPTSVTPFSGPATDRALHAVFISLIRHLLGLKRDNQASEFSSTLDDLKNVIEIISERVSIVSEKDLGTVHERLSWIIDRWEEIAEVNSELTYSNSHKKHLIYPFGEEQNEYLPTLRSMRNVDQECNINILD